MHRIIRRAMTTTAATVGGLALLTGTANAHFCIKEGMPSQAANGKAWSTPAEFIEIVPFFDAPEDCKAAVIGYVADLPDGSLLMGPGLLAGGTLKNGKGNTPDGITYIPFPQLCPGVE